MTAAIPDLELLAQRDDIVGASALEALDALGQSRSPDVLTSLLSAKTPAVRAYSAQKLGALGSANSDAFEKVQAVLASNDDATVRAAAAHGLGASKDPAALDALDKAMLRNDGASREAAAAISAIGTERAAQMLKTAVVDGEGEAQTGAVMALVDFGDGCKDCSAFLKEQLASNPEKAVRDLISILLELNVRHDH
jgi:HEAT repeat protein